MEVASLEWWFYEFLVLLSGLLPHPELQTSTLAAWWGTTRRNFFTWILKG
jgi:hypothetical protein